jgi:NADH-quinone oxidoreductase subunit J
MILFLFGVMLTRARVGRETDLNNKNWAIGIPVALLMLGAMVYVLLQGFGDDRLQPTSQVSTAELSDSIFKPFLLPFWALSFVLLAAVIGAIVLARKD